MYHAQKYRVAAATLPETLHWFKWEAYTTWISGMFMMALMYWYGAEIYLIDPGVAELSKTAAVVIGIAFIAVGWFAYDYLCKSEIGNNENAMAAILLIALSLVAFVLCQLYSGRGAYMHFGAMLGTIMVGNVFFVIIPGQKDMVRAMEEGREPNPIHGVRGKQRSVHNTYFTLPVLFVMVSNHYAMTYGHKLNWLILIAITLIGAFVRVYFVARHKGHASPVPLLLALALLFGIVTLVAPYQNDRLSSKLAATVDIAAVQRIVSERCSSCHAKQPSQAGFQVAPKGIVFETQDDIVRQAVALHQQTVVTRAMPIGNLTGITDDERATIAAWYTQQSR